VSAARWSRRGLLGAGGALLAGGAAAAAEGGDAPPLRPLFPARLTGAAAAQTRPGDRLTLRAAPTAWDPRSVAARAADGTPMGALSPVDARAASGLIAAGFALAAVVRRVEGGRRGVLVVDVALAAGPSEGSAT
jgi:hypothetical protein